MHGGERWLRLRRILDVAQDAGAFQRCFDAHAAECGSLGSLVELGAKVLYDSASAELRRKSYSKIVQEAVEDDDVAWLATRDTTLARLFNALGLYGRLRHHAHPLTSRARADTVRAIAAEVHLAIKGNPPRWSRPWLSAQDPGMGGYLLRELGALALQVYFERPRGLRRQARTDPTLHMLLLTGSARAILARLRELHKAKGKRTGADRDNMHYTLVELLPKLQPIRLLVFMQVLHALCNPTANAAAGSKGQYVEQQALVSAVVEAILASELDYLPHELPQELRDIKESRFLSEDQRELLLEMMMGVDEPQWLVPYTKEPLSPALEVLSPRRRSPSRRPLSWSPVPPPLPPAPLEEEERWEWSPRRYTTWAAEDEVDEEGRWPARLRRSRSWVSPAAPDDGVWRRTREPPPVWWISPHPSPRQLAIQQAREQRLREQLWDDYAADRILEQEAREGWSRRDLPNADVWDYYEQVPRGAWLDARRLPGSPAARATSPWLYRAVWG